MTTNTVPDNRAPIYLRNWLLASGDPLRDLSLFASGFSQPHEDSHTQALATEQSQRTVQIVTPNVTLRQLLTRCLLTLDLVVTETIDRPDLIVLDLAAPDALTYCQTLRQRDPHLLILVLVPLAANQQPAWEAGANLVVTIPFDALELHTCIRRLPQSVPSSSPAGDPSWR